MNPYFEISKHLRGHKIRYLLAGSLASNLYGAERATRYIALIVDFEKENHITFEKTLWKIIRPVRKTRKPLWQKRKIFPGTMGIYLARTS